MKRAKLIPSILMLILCVSVLAIGIYSAMPTTNTINGTINITASASLQISITAYLDNSGLSDDTVMSSTINTKSSNTLTLKKAIDFNCGDIYIGEHNKVPAKKLYLRVTNTSTMALGAYFLEGTISSSGTTKSNIATTRNLNGTSSSGVVENIVTSDFSSYTKIEPGATVKMYSIFTLNEVKREAITIDFTNNLTLNVEEYNSALENETVTTNTINFTNNDVLAVQTDCVIENANPEIFDNGTSRVTFGKNSWNIGSLAFSEEKWGNVVNGVHTAYRLQPIKISMKVTNNDVVPIKVSIANVATSVIANENIDTFISGCGYIAPGTTEEIWVQYASNILRTEDNGYINTLDGLEIPDYGYKVTIEKFTEQTGMEVDVHSRIKSDTTSNTYTSTGLQYYIEFGDNPYYTTGSTKHNAKLRWYIWAKEVNGQITLLDENENPMDESNKGTTYFFIAQYGLDFWPNLNSGLKPTNINCEIDVNTYLTPEGIYASNYVGTTYRKWLTGETVKNDFYTDYSYCMTDGIISNFYSQYNLMVDPLFNQIVGRTTDNLYVHDAVYASLAGGLPDEYKGQVDKFWILSNSEVMLMTDNGTNWDNAATTQLSQGSEPKNLMQWWATRSPVDTREAYVVDSFSGGLTGQSGFSAGIYTRYSKFPRPAFKLCV